MGSQAEQFLASFNRIEKWLREQEQQHTNLGFAELVRRLSSRSDLLVRRYRHDLLEMAQLRNAIVHDKIGPDFVIAEPNEWVLTKMAKIEQNLTLPERLGEHFRKKVAVFQSDTPLVDVLAVMKQKGYSQFPIVSGQQVVGLVTAHGLGMFLAHQQVTRPLDLAQTVVEEVLQNDRHRENYQFIAVDAFCFQGLERFLGDPTVEALLLTRDGQPSTELLGIIRPKELFQKKYKEWWNQE